jgi:hypothetical protein
MPGRETERFRDAIECYRRALKLNPTGASIISVACWLISEKWNRHTSGLLRRAFLNPLEVLNERLDPRLDSLLRGLHT